MQHDRPVGIAPFACLVLLGAAAPAQTWRIVGPDPVPRYVHGMVRDPVTERLLVVGGRTTYFLGLSTTALRVGTRWNELRDVPSPQLHGYGLAPDPVRGRVVLYGGYTPAGVLSTDTWEWDGAAWTRVATSGPQVWQQAVLCWHGGTGRVLLYGAGPATTLTTQTWEWDGSTWTQRLGVLDAGRRLNHAMCYDVARDRIVLFGGRLDILTTLNDTWEYDGTSWTVVQPTVSPPPMAEMAMAYDEQRLRTVLFGDGTWEFDGTTWVQRTPANAPTSRRYHAMAFDRTRGRVVLHAGGRDSILGVDASNETWEWDGTTWSSDTATRGPGKRNEAVIATDPATGRALVHGGFRGPTNFTDTWRLDADRWTLLPATAPQPLLRESRIVGDVARGNVLAFPAGGSGPRTWTLQGGVWTQQSPAAEPPSRATHALACDPDRGVVVLFGGFDTALRRMLGDTWEYDGATWTQRAGPAPSPRSEHAMCTDTAGGGVLLFGGFGGTGLLGDTWRLGAGGWRQLASHGPSPRFQAAMTGDSVRRRVVLVAGLDQQGSPSDHWEWNGAQWTRVREPLPVATTWYLADGRRGAVLMMDGLAWERTPPRASAAMVAGGGCPGVLGVPRLEAGGLPLLGATAFEVVLDRAKWNSFALLLADGGPLPQPLPVCGLALAAPVALRLDATSPVGATQWPVTIPDDPSLRGLRLHLQAAVLDPAGGFLGTASLSNVLALVVDD